MDYVLGIIIGILFIFLIGGLEGILLPLGKFVLKIFHIKKFLSFEISRRDQNIVELAGLIFYIIIISALIYIKNIL